MQFRPVTRSLRFRLTGMTSAVVFGVGGLALAVIYLTVLAQVRNLTERQIVTVRQGPFVKIGEAEFRTLESFLNELILQRVGVTILVVIVVLFVASLLVGWVVAGRALRPISRMTAVAREIEATDLSRRIGLDGPDDELTLMGKTFDAMLDRLDKAFRTQKADLAEISHDLRTPLAIIRSNLDVTMSDPDVDVEGWRETGAIALRASERMSRMIDELLATARLEAGVPTLVNVDLADLSRQSAGDLAARAAEAAVELNVVARSALVLGDRLSLSRAVANLIDNAIGAAPAETTVTVGAGSVGDWGYVAVADRGSGVEPAVVRGEKPVMGRLGLSIVRDIARHHGGSVDAKVRPGGGSVVALWVPLGAGSGSDRPHMDALPVF